jgi:hypothetical protein
MMDPVVDPKRRRQTIVSTVVPPAISEQCSHHRNLNEMNLPCRISDSIRDMSVVLQNLVPNLPHV